MQTASFTWRSVVGAAVSAEAKESSTSKGAAIPGLPWATGCTGSTDRQPVSHAGHRSRLESRSTFRTLSRRNAMAAPPQYSLNAKDVQRDELPVDVLLVGAGPANLACAIHLQRLLK